MQLLPVEVFYSYADVDAPLLGQLEKHLSLLRHEGQITTWHKHQILAGTNEKETIDHHLNTASLILLLITPDFLASNYCYGVEMQRAMQRHEANEAQIIPLLLRPVDWQSAPFGKLQALPRNGKPLTSWTNRDAAFLDIAQGIRSVLVSIQQGTISSPPFAFPKVWQIPYPRNLMFTGREEVLQEITSSLQSEQPVVISGLGGIGKTQIAVEYAYKHAAHYQAVFWVPAETRDVLISGYISIAKQLHFPQAEEQEQVYAVKAVQEWLRTHTQWLLILDNVEDLSMSSEFLPPIFKGHVILTTRVQATRWFTQSIAIETLESSIGALLLLRRAGLLLTTASLKDTDIQVTDLAHKISTELGGLPLALDQAGAYIEETQCSLLDYQQRYRTHRAFLLKRRGGSAAQHLEPVATTWALTFEKVDQSNAAAGDLLRLCAFLHPDEIPEVLLTKGAPHLGLHLSSVAADSFLLDNAIFVLGAYSLLHRDARAHTLSIHRLVQGVLKDAMEKETRQQWAQRTVRAVNALLPDTDFAAWTLCEQCLPHAQACALLIEEEEMTFPEAAKVLHWIGTYLLERIRTQEAGPFLQQALTLRERWLSFGHVDIADTIDRLARFFENQGQYAEAEPFYQRALTIREQHLGPMHPDTAQSLNNLAELYYQQGKYREVEPFYQRALAIDEKAFGLKHVEVATDLSNLALLYKTQGKYVEAELFYQRAQGIYEQELGPMHPDTATNFNNLAALYDVQRKYTEAEPFYQRALTIREQQLGPMHPDTAQSLNNLAELYRNQGKNLKFIHKFWSSRKNAEAELLHQRALTIREQQLGPMHPDTAQSLNNLAELYRNQGKHTKAESLYQRALTIEEQQLGPMHPSTAISLNNLALLYNGQRKYTKAEPLYQRALEICECILGQEHPTTQIVRKNYASLRCSMDRKKQRRSWRRLFDFFS